jgi:hypothetical protein
LFFPKVWNFRNLGFSKPPYQLQASGPIPQCYSKDQEDHHCKCGSSEHIVPAKIQRSKAASRPVDYRPTYKPCLTAHLTQLLT